ncbi:helix-turn-helix transcriptional regulator [Phytohabitans rumicis]|uniref:Transcriptional regulator n=1 Tax=Phytohabitans rumicis TaxID=1076125 RepID=A0A6V8L9T9_9ACTN|nr:LuxR C-terminal-related transcriptional regulator [Phytohabitans rumicis]GFJ93992.1 transcriptional regulator [Phytohabitans rumicis]
MGAQSDVWHLRMTGAVPSLVAWGATPDADLIYRRLLTLGPARAAALRQELGLSRQRIADALDELTSIGAAVAGLAAAPRDAIWTARTAPEVIASLRRSRLRQTVGDTARHRRTYATAPAGPIGQVARIGEGVRHLRTRAMTRTRLAELVGVARHEHLAMNPEHVFDAESARPAVSMDRTLLERGVHMRVLGVQAGSPDPMVWYGRTPTEAIPAYRAAVVVPMKLFVVDRRIAIFPVTPTDFDHGYLEVTQPAVVAALVALFEQQWAAGRDPEQHSLPRITLDPRELALIELLARGHTDTTAARELRISTRSVSSIVRGLMDRLGVDNRFQLGLALGALHVTAVPARTLSTA